MLLNHLEITDLSGEICYKFENNDNIIKLGTFEITPKYNHVKIILGDIAIIEYEYRTPDNLKVCTGTPHMYWIKSQYVCDRCHGTILRDDPWVNKIFEMISPYQDDVNIRLMEFFRIAFDSVAIDTKEE
jgi:hypothetical protein